MFLINSFFHLLEVNLKWSSGPRFQNEHLNQTRPDHTSKRVPRILAIKSISLRLLISLGPRKLANVNKTKFRLLAKLNYEILIEPNKKFQTILILVGGARSLSRPIF